MLNLLPPEIKQGRQVKSLLFNTIIVYVVIGAVIALVTGGLATWSFLQESEIGGKQSQIEQLSSQRRSKEELVSKASFIEDRVKSAGSLQEKRRWENILSDIASATPTDTALTTVRVATSTQPGNIDLTIGGTTTDRRSIVLYRDKLEAAEFISKTAILTLAESEIEGKKQFTFGLSAIYNDEKKKGKE